MEFKLWLESNILSWDDFASPYHHFIKRALKSLLRQKPEILNKQLDFDGFSPGTVKEFLGAPEFHGKKDQLPKYLYTGTSYYRWEKIREEGLKPRSETSEEPVFGASISSAPPANPDHIYLAVTLGATVRWAASDASRDGSYPVILRIDSQGIDPNRIRPDVDIRSDQWLDSFHKLGTIAYEGKIAPRFAVSESVNLIELIQAKKGDRWEKPGSWLEPQDWLAQQDYKKIPD